MKDLGAALIFVGIVVVVAGLDAFWNPGFWLEKLDAAYKRKDQ